MSSSIQKIAHRGASGFSSENSLAAFQKAIDFKVDGIELDVHLSSDGQLVVIHDETLDRTTTENGFVCEKTASELQKLNIPTLIEVLDLVNTSCFVNIELKASETETAVVYLIENFVKTKNWQYSHFIVSSFDWEMLEKVQLLNPKIRIGVLTEDSIAAALAFAEKTHAFSIHPNYILLSYENVALMQNKGFEVLTWTVNKTEDIQKIKSYKVNGIISDFPDRI